MELKNLIMANQRRIYKVSEQIRTVIASELQRISDPRLQMVTITSVRVSSDLKHAKVYWTVDKTRVEEVTEGFVSARGHIRTVLAKSVDLRFIPTLKFFYDDTLDTCEEVDALLAQISGD